MQSETTIAGQVLHLLIMIVRNMIVMMLMLVESETTVADQVLTIMISPSPFTNHRAGNVGICSRWKLVPRKRDQPGKRCIHGFWKVQYP